MLMCLFHCIWVSCLGVCQIYQVIFLAMTTNERMNVRRYKHFHTSRPGVYSSPFSDGHVRNLVRFFSGGRGMYHRHQDLDRQDRIV